LSLYILERERPKHNKNCECKYCKNGLKIPHSKVCGCTACRYGYR
jgi:hypothetical protein